MLKERDDRAFDFSAVQSVYVSQPESLESWLAERRARGIDRGDEVWNGVYYVPPNPTNEHQRIAWALATAIQNAIGDKGVVYPMVNISDRETDWSRNYRIPDVAVVLKSNRRCLDRKTHFFGGPDFVVEVESPDDRSRQKFDFYAGIGVREYLILEDKTRRPLLYQLVDAAFMPVAPKKGVVASGVLPLSFRAARGQLIATLTRKPFKRWVI